MIKPKFELAGLLLSPWRPIEARVDGKEPLTLYRGDSLTVSQPDFRFSKFHQFIGWLHGVRFYNEWQPS